MSWLKAKDWATGVEYSSLFHSGLRAISLQPRVRGARANSSRSSSRENSSSEGTSSIRSLSSHLLRRRAPRTRHPSPSISVSSDPSPSPPPLARKVPRRRPSSMFARPTKETADPWSSGRSFIEIEEHPRFSEEEDRFVGYLMLPIEMDARSRSILVNLGEMDATVASPTGGESFLSLSNSSDVFLHHPIPRHARPASLLTMPLPLSRHSSLHRPRTREARRERGDYAWKLEDPSPEVKVYEFWDEGVRLDDEANVEDWRQFHVDWLRNIC